MPRLLRLVLVPTSALALLLAALAAPSWSGAGASAAPRPAQEARPREVWWSQEWARIVDLDGGWRARTVHGTAVLEPEGAGARLDLLGRLTGRVHTFTFQPEGQVAFLEGWIMLDTEGPLAALQPVDEELLRGVSRSRLKGIYGPIEGVESIEWYGPAEWRHGRKPGPRGGLRMAQVLPGEADAPSLVAHLVDGDTCVLPAERTHTVLWLEQSRTVDPDSGEERIKLHIQSSGAGG